MNNKNELVRVTRSSMPPFDEYVEEIRDLWESYWLTNMGKKHVCLQERLKEYLGVEYIDLLVNGHMALELSLQAMGIKGEVITTPFTFASTTHAIVRNGLEPVFCDINPIDYTIDVSQIESLITEKTSAIVPVHVYGNVCDVNELDKIAQKHKLKIIYDAAHAFGVKIGDTGIGNYGDASCFSFHATKVFNSIEGGAVSFRDEKFGHALYGLKNFGIRGEELVDGIGANAKMNEFCAAMGLCNLKYIDEEIAKRKKIVETYRSRLDGVEGLRICPVQDNVKSNYAYFPIVFEDNYKYSREQVFFKLQDKNIFARKYFYPLTNTFPCFNEKYDVKKTPCAFEISNKILTLPLYADLSMDIVNEICDVILK